MTGICSRAIKVPLLLKRLNMDGMCSRQSQEILTHELKATKFYNLLTSLFEITFDGISIRWITHVALIFHFWS